VIRAVAARLLAQASNAGGRLAVVVLCFLLLGTFVRPMRVLIRIKLLTVNKKIEPHEKLTIYPGVTNVRHGTNQKGRTGDEDSVPVFTP
jgi:hypothetical protein